MSLNQCSEDQIINDDQQASYSAVSVLQYSLANEVYLAQNFAEGQADQLRKFTNPQC
jgi:hypothetical protein